jgi:hypothetical protein
MRGSRPGERRGGRQKGTPNKKTALAQAAIVARAANENLSPLDLMLAIMRDPHVALVTRVKMALRALPLLHTKLKAVPSGSSGLGHNGAAVPSSDGAKKSNSDSRKSAPATHGEAKAEAVNNRAAAPGADRPDDAHESSRKSTTNGDANAELGSGGAAAQSVDRPEESETDSRNNAPAATTEAGANHPDRMPLDFLLSLMRHPKTPATLRIKMALATQPYIHPRKSNRPTSPVAAAGDRHGFEVEPALAKKLRNVIARLAQLKRRRNPRPEDQKTVQKLQQKIEAKIATLQCPCPSRYSVEDAARDKQTLARLWRRRRSRAKLTAREDTALAHINARYTAYAWGPEAHGRTRLTALREKRRVFRRAGGPRLSSYERAELRGLAILYPPELSKIDEDYHAREWALATLNPPDSHESTFGDFEEFVEVPSFFTGNPNYL